VSRVDLDGLLSNPQFLKLFSDAYIESNRHFSDKRSIFEKAVTRLARETNSSIVAGQSSMPLMQKIDLSSEIFAKLLLSGSEGVSITEADENRMYPSLVTLLDRQAVYNEILSTQLFKLGENVNHHRPVHKTITEYCAAEYLTKRIQEPENTLTLTKCLAVIAPNSTARDELRGLLGWMATLGDKVIEETIIELDVYAVLANGDPSQLQNSSKLLLINKLKETEEQDPFFRKGDFLRSFSTSGFFTPDVLEAIKPILNTEDNGHLQGLLLEMLKGDKTASVNLTDELQRLVLNPETDLHTRTSANECLLSSQSPIIRDCLNSLVDDEATEVSLHVAADSILELNFEESEPDYLSHFLKACSKLYPPKEERLKERIVGSRYFVRSFISKLKAETIQKLLDELTCNLSCICGKKSYECDCRNGISKIVGMLLDRYFELTDPPYDALQVWTWIKNLNFHRSVSAKESRSVQFLQQNSELRQGMIVHAFGSLKTYEEVHHMRLNCFSSHQAHSGLYLQADDNKFIVDFAFENDHPVLWACFIARHQYFRNDEYKGPDILRLHMKKQAKEKPAFMREWALANRASKRSFKEDNKWRARSNRISKKHQNERDENRVKNLKYLQENRPIVESGNHFGFLHVFSYYLLEKPEEILQEFGDEELVHNSLSNCLNFISEHIPNLQRLAELQCASQSLYAEQILYAACIEILRTDGNLQTVSHNLLRALRTNLNMHYSAVSEGERNLLKTELDRLLFCEDSSAEEFLRTYVEPQLESSKCQHPEIWLLNENSFYNQRSKLSIEWLNKFKNLQLSTLSELFDLALKHGDKIELVKVISSHCEEISKFTGPLTEAQQKIQQFWFIRSWYFIQNSPEIYWDWLSSDKNTIFVLNNLSGRMNRHEAWPTLTSEKIERVLDAFTSAWPKVPLPSHWGSDSPDDEVAYRFLTEIIWSINSDNPDSAIPVLDRLICDPRYVEFHKSFMSIRADQLKKQALRDFEAPTPIDIVNLLDCDEVVTVEGLRELIISELQQYQKEIDGSEFNISSRFYDAGKRKDENSSTEIIAERLNTRLAHKGITVTLEHQMKDNNRSDFTVSKTINGKRRLLVTEVKGQWHRELYTAASAQLYERYSIHPDAEQQGIFLAIWFGSDENVAGRKKHGFQNAQELKLAIEEQIPKNLSGLIDVFVLDVSRS